MMLAVLLRYLEWVWFPYTAAAVVLVPVLLIGRLTERWRDRTEYLGEYEMTRRPSRRR